MKKRHGRFISFLLVFTLAFTSLVFPTVGVSGNTVVADYFCTVVYLETEDYSFVEEGDTDYSDSDVNAESIFTPYDEDYGYLRNNDCKFEYYEFDLTSMSMSAPTITNISASTSSFNHAGGTSTITVTGNDLVPANMRIAAFLHGSGPFYSQAPSGTDSSVSTDITFPQNTSGPARTYQIRASFDNGITWSTTPTTSVTVNGTGPANMTANPWTVNHGGGVSTISVSGNDLVPENIRVAAFLGGMGSPLFTQTPTGSDTNVTAELTFPENTGRTHNMYVVRVSTDDGVTWMNSPSATVMVNAPIALSLSASQVVGHPGRYVDIDVNIDVNTGLTLAGLSVGFNSSVLEFAGHTAGNVMLLPPPHNFDVNPFSLNFELAEPFGVTTATGNLVTLRFRVLDDAREGFFPITLNVLSAAVAEGNNFVPIQTEAINGAVTVSHTMLGDLNGDWQVNVVDVGLLRAHLVQLPVDVNTLAADVNLDGRVDIMDLGLLRAYLVRLIPSLPPPAVGYVTPFAISEITPFAASGGSAKFSASNVSGSSGDYVDVVISLDENDGLTLASLTMGFDDEVLAFVSHAIHDVMTFPPPHNFDINPFTLNFELQDIFGVTTATGNLATIRFRVLDSASLGMSPITLSVNAAAVAEGFSFAPVQAEAMNGSVNIAGGQATIPPTITSFAAPSGTVGVTYGIGGSGFQFGATGTPAPTWTHTGTLPPGLSLSPQGRLIGTPTTAGTFNFTITASNGVAPNASRQITVNITPFPIVTDSTLSLSTAFALQGDTATVQLRIDNNPGFAAMLMRLTFSEHLTLTGYEVGRAGLSADMLDDLYDGFVSPGLGSADSFIGWAGRDTDISINGVLLTLTFTINSGTPMNAILPINLVFESYVYGYEVPTNAAGNEVEIGIIAGEVRVQSSSFGDSNRDGRVTSADATVLARYLAGHNITIDRRAVDLNGDGEVDGADLILLVRWLVGHGAPPVLS